MDTTDILARSCALACWAEIATDDVKHVDGYEFRTPAAIYFVMDEDEANDAATEEADHRWAVGRTHIGLSHRNGPPDDYYAATSRGALLADDRLEHNFNDEWFIYRQDIL
jgi:hypothetical protein